MVGEGRCLEVPPARGSEIPRGSETAYSYIMSTCRNFIALRDLPAPHPNPFDPPRREGLGGHAHMQKTPETNEKPPLYPSPRVAVVKMFFWRLGSRHNDDKGSDTPFRTIEKCKRAARTAAAPAEPEIVASTRAAAPEAPEPEKRLVEQVCILF